MNIMRLLVCALLTSGAVSAELNVVATLSTFGDLVETIGGEHVTVDVIAPPQYNPHFIEPRPSDVLKVKRADVFVHGGLDLEVWRDALLNAAGNPRAISGGAGEISLAEGVRLMNVPPAGTTRSAGDIHLYGNPHFWLGPENGLVMAGTIARRLGEIDPAHAADYKANLAAFEEKLKSSIDAWRTDLAGLSGTELIAYHDEWPYFAEFAGIKLEQFLEPKPGIPPGPKHLSSLEAYARANGVSGILYTSISAPKPVKTLAERTGVPAIELAQGVGEVPAATDYIALIDYNVRQLTSVLGS